jgi:hypothetical protein
MNVQSVSGIILTVENRITSREISPSVTSPTANPTYTDLGLCPDFIRDKLAHK